MPDFKDLHSLAKYLQTQIGDVLQSEVADNVSDKMKERYQDEVYSYARQYGSRRMSLVDDNNIKKEMVSTDTVSISNIAKPDESVFGTSLREDPEGLLPEWIEGGDIPNVFNDRTDYPWTKPRPVIQHTKEDIERSGSHVEAMKKGLIKKGFTVK